MPRVVPKHAWRIPMMELKRLEAGDMFRLGLATAGIGFAHQEALRLALETGGGWIWTCGCRHVDPKLKSRFFPSLSADFSVLTGPVKKLCQI